MTYLIQNLGWTDLKTRRKNSRLLCMFKILNELVEIPINDRLIPADRRTRGGHNQAYKHIRAGTKFFLASNYPWLEFSSSSCHRNENCGSIQESASRLDLPASFPPPAWYSTMEGCWSIYSKSKSKRVPLPPICACATMSGTAGICHSYSESSPPPRLTVPHLSCFAVLTAKCSPPPPLPSAVLSVPL